jgi:hypothetical protein
LGPGRYFRRRERGRYTNADAHCDGDRHGYCYPHCHGNCNGIGHNHTAPVPNAQRRAISKAASHASAAAIDFGPKPVWVALVLRSGRRGHHVSASSPKLFCSGDLSQNLKIRVDTVWVIQVERDVPFLELREVNIRGRKRTRVVTPPVVSTITIIIL